MFAAVLSRDVERAIEQTKVVASLDFAILVPGHDAVDTIQDATDKHLDVEHPKTEVTAALDDGQDRGAQDMLHELDIRGMIRWLAANG